MTPSDLAALAALLAESVQALREIEPSPYHWKESIALQKNEQALAIVEAAAGFRLVRTVDHDCPEGAYRKDMDAGQTCRDCREIVS